ncbi:MAG: TonB-dependent receptor [Chitinophagales bacterium]
MIKKIELLCCLMLFCIVTFAQQKQKHTISGYVEDAQTGEKLIGANVYEGSTFVGTTTNVYGFFSLTLPADSVQLKVSFIGYNNYNQNILLNENKQINIALSSGELLNEVEVIATEVSETIEERSQMSAVSIPIQQIKSLPTFLGEVDVLKALQLLPGIQSGSEGSSGLYVRGGGPDQNLILLDGVPVYNASHLFGFFSVFNADAINSVELIKGGFPARYGGRLSSVIDIRMKEGNMKKISGSASIGLISSKLTLEGPIIKDKTSFIISGRRTYIDVLARPFILLANNSAKEPLPAGTTEEYRAYGGYYFYDLNAKINHKFSDKDRIYLSAYMGNDRFYFTEKSEYEDQFSKYDSDYGANTGWGNITSMLRWNHVLSPKMFSNVAITYSNYNMSIGYNSKDYFLQKAQPEFNLEEEELRENSGFEYFSGIRDFGGKIDFDFVPSPQHYLKFGVNATQHYFQPGGLEFSINGEEAGETLDTLLNESFVNALEYAAYIEDDIRIGKHFKANVGLHYSGFAVDDTLFQSLQPRFSARYLLKNRWSLKASYANMTQYIHLLSNSSAVDLPTDLWVPATKKILPQNSRQVAAGVAHTLLNGLELSVEGYYKAMNNLIAYKDGASYLSGDIGSQGNDWQNQVEIGKGKAYGVELLMQQKKGNTTGWIGYTLSWTNRTFEEINFGETFPYKYDRRHDIAIAIMHKFNDRIEVSANWVFGTGNAVTLALATYERANLPYNSAAEALSYYNNPFGYGTIKHYDSRNGFRMANYHRFDIGASFIKKKKHGERRWNVGFYNVYNRKNPFFLYIDSEREADGTYKNVYKQVSIIPILPSVSWNRSF